MPDYSRPHFANGFLGEFGNERTGTLESDLPPATDDSAEVAVPQPNQLLRIVAILIMAAVVYFILKKLCDKSDVKLDKPDEEPKIEG